MASTKGKDPIVGVQIAFSNISLVKTWHLLWQQFGQLGQEGLLLQLEHRHFLPRSRLKLQQIVRQRFCSSMR
jgi:hypothetical protein